MNDAVIVSPGAKYSKDGDFHEPVVICDKCAKLLLLSDLHKIGKCVHCGNTRVRNVMVLNDENMAIAKAWADEGKIDPDWLKLFGPVEVNA